MGGGEARRRCLKVDRGELSQMSWLQVLTIYEGVASKCEKSERKKPVPPLSGDGMVSSVRAAERWV